MTNTSSVLRIGQPKTILNKRQKEFNLLSEKISHLEELIPELHRAYDEIVERIPKDLNPLINEYQTFRAELVRIMDRTYQSDLFRKIYLTKLTYLITENAFDLIVNFGFDDLRPVYNRYSNMDIETAIAEASRKSAGRITDPASLLEEAKEEEFIFSENFHDLPEEEQQRIKEEQREQNLKAQIEEAKEKAAGRKASRSVRTVYMDLVKAFHPDLETDESEKIRKTEIMQRVTRTYQENNLMELLKLQIEYERKDHDHLENLNSNQLNYYNKVLKQQVEDLEKEKEIVQQRVASVCGLLPKHINSFTTAVVKFNSNVNQMKAEVKEMKNTVQAWKVPSRMKAYLKTYEIPEEPEWTEDDL